MQQLSCDSCQAFKQWSRNSRTTQYPPTLPYTSHIGVQHHTFPAVDLVECTSHVTPPLQHRCLTSWRKLPQHKTFPLASVLHINPSLALVLSLSTHSDRSKPHLLRPPSQQLLPGDMHWSRECTQNIAICRERPCSTMRQPRGQRERPTALHHTEHPSPPNRLHLGGLILFHNPIFEDTSTQRIPSLYSYSIIFWGPHTHRIVGKLCISWWLCIE